jgi:hypothetical protein
MNATVVLKCDMDPACTRTVTHIDNKGFAYCTGHGETRKRHRPCRKLRPHERTKLERGEQLARY